MLAYRIVSANDGAAQLFDIRWSFPGHREKSSCEVQPKREKGRDSSSLRQELNLLSFWLLMDPIKCPLTSRRKASDGAFHVNATHYESLGILQDANTIFVGHGHLQHGGAAW